MGIQKLPNRIWNASEKKINVISVKVKKISPKKGGVIYDPPPATYMTVLPHDEPV